MRWGLFGFAFSALILAGCSCNEEKVELPGADQRDPVTGLTPTEAQEVLVTVGETKITLGDYAATLLRMDRYERLRYQSEERQRELLEEMIEVELLAQEARRRGLEKDPKVQLRIQQALRDEVLKDLEKDLPSLDSFTEREVREYYDAHRNEFKEPERRRVMVIKFGQKSVAEATLEEAKEASGQTWGELFDKYSLDRVEAEAPELAGDLGFVSAPGEERGENVSVPPAVRKAVFELKEVGDVLPRVVADESYFFIVRLGGLSPARDRSAKDADRTIRVELRRQKFLEAEKKLEAELRKQYPVVIDKEAIASYQPKVQSSDDSGAKPEKKPTDPSPEKQPAEAPQPE